MQIKCLEITSAVKLLKDTGNQVEDTIEGWTKVELDVNMKKPLTDAVRDKIIAEIPGLKYWKYKGSPHNPAGEGFVCEKHKISLTFPAG